MDSPDRFDGSETLPAVGRLRRLTALLIVVALLVGVIVSTALSLGRYCLTTDGLDVRTLPAAHSTPHAAR